jgi:putative iron-dependent peroxidase
MATTGGDIFVHLRCAARDVLFRAVVDVKAAAGDNVVRHVHGWRNGAAGRNDDLTGFEDGVENCPAAAVSREVFLPPGGDNACGTFLLAQTWRHNFTAWSSLSTPDQEAVFGRTKATSKRLGHPAPNAHVVKVSQRSLGFHVLRLSAPWGEDESDAGLIFLAYSNRGDRLAAMCAAMAARQTGRDRVMDISQCIESNLYYVPSADTMSLLIT